MPYKVSEIQTVNLDEYGGGVDKKQSSANKIIHIVDASFKVDGFSIIFHKQKALHAVISLI